MRAGRGGGAGWKRLGSKPFTSTDDGLHVNLLVAAESPSSHVASTKPKPEQLNAAGTVKNTAISTDAVLRHCELFSRVSVGLQRCPRMGTDSVWLIFSARIIVDSAARVSRPFFPSLSLLLLCRDNGGLESARARACARSAVASADCGMGVSAAHCETRGSTSMQRRSYRPWQAAATP